MPKEPYICIRECYHCHRLYKVGDPLEPGDEPNHHFALKSEVPEEPEMGAKTAADDPRSTEEMRRILIEKYNIKPAKDASRKVLFDKLRRKEIEKPDEKPAQDKKDK